MLSLTPVLCLFLQVEVETQCNVSNNINNDTFFCWCELKKSVKRANWEDYSLYMESILELCCVFVYISFIWVELYFAHLMSATKTSFQCDSLLSNDKTSYKSCPNKSWAYLDVQREKCDLINLSRDCWFGGTHPQTLSVRLWQKCTAESNRWVRRDVGDERKYCLEQTLRPLSVAAQKSRKIWNSSL